MAKKQKTLDKASKLLIAFLILFATIIVAFTLYFTTGLLNTTKTIFITNDIETNLVDSEGDSHPITVTLHFEVDSSKARKYESDKMQSELENSISNISYDEFENSDDPVSVIKQTATDTLLGFNPDAVEDIEGVYVSDIQTGQRRIAGDDTNAAKERQSNVMRGLFRNMD